MSPSSTTDEDESQTLWQSSGTTGGVRGHHHLHEQSNHPATDGLVNMFTKANHDLLVVQHRLEKEFQQIYPENANPMKLVARIKKMQEELSGLKKKCQELLSAKQDLIDKARTTLVC